MRISTFRNEWWCRPRGRWIEQEEEEEEWLPAKCRVLNAQLRSSLFPGLNNRSWCRMQTLTF